MVDKSTKIGLIEFGIGVISYVTLDAIANAVKKLEKEGRLNKKEGERMMRDVFNKYQTTSSKYAKGVRSQFDNLVKASPFATKKDIENLNAKIDELSTFSKKTNVKRISKMRSRKRSK